jgi:hypothetical protein
MCQQKMLPERFDYGHLEGPHLQPIQSVMDALLLHMLTKNEI